MNKLNNAIKVYEQYVNKGLSTSPPFKGFGIQLVRFALENPDLYQILAVDHCELSLNEYMQQHFLMNKVTPYIEKEFNLDEGSSKWLFTNGVIFAQGLVTSIAATNDIPSDEYISKCLGNTCRSLLILLQAPVDERVNIMPEEGKVIKGDVEDYVKGRKNVIIGYDQEKVSYQIALDSILYFEAIEDDVFAYTKEGIYTIKRRLYQIELMSKDDSFLRISKSMLVNMRKVKSISSYSAGRIEVHLINDESVIASRAYNKELTKAFNKAYIVL